MAGERTVKVKFDGDATGLARASQTARQSVDEATSGLDRFGEGADTADTRAMGFRDTLTGVQDGLKGAAMLAKGPSFEAFLLLGTGVGDLGSGIFNFLVPAMKALNLANIKSAASTVAHKVATIASTVASKAAALGSKAWAAAQWILNAALSANPIGLVIAAVAALIAIIVLIATKTDWFQRLWKTVWGGIKAAAAAVASWFSGTLWPWMRGVWDGIAGAAGRAKDWIVDRFNGLVGWFSSLPGRLADFGRRAWWGLVDSARAAINWLIGMWNGIDFAINVPGFLGWGGIHIGDVIPDIPYLARGGTATRGGLALVGERGPELLAMPRGASVIPLDRGAGVHIENLNVRAYSDRFSLRQVMDDLAWRGAH